MWKKQHVEHGDSIHVHPVYGSLRTWQVRYMKFADAALSGSDLHALMCKKHVSLNGEKAGRRHFETTAWKLKSDLHAFKHVRVTGTNTPAIANLIIPKGAVVVSVNLQFSNRLSEYTHRKFRAERAIVHSIVGLREGLKGAVMPYTEASPGYQGGTPVRYRPGEEVRPHNGFSPAYYSQCAQGIHFFVNVIDALQWSGV